MRVLTFYNCYLFRCGFRKKPRQDQGRRPSSSQASACVLASWPGVSRLERLLSSSSSKALKFALESLPPRNAPRPQGGTRFDWCGSCCHRPWPWLSPGSTAFTSTESKPRETSSYEWHHDGVCEHHRHMESHWRRTVPCTSTAPLPGTGFGCLGPVFSACPDRPGLVLRSQMQLAGACSPAPPPMPLRAAWWRGALGWPTAGVAWIPTHHAPDSIYHPPDETPRIYHGTQESKSETLPLIATG